MRPLAGALALILSVDAAPAAANDMPAPVRIVGPYAKAFMYVADRMLGVRGLTEHCIGETRAWAATIAAAEMARLEAPPGELAHARAFCTGSSCGVYAVAGI